MSDDVVEVWVGRMEFQTSNFAETIFVKVSAPLNWSCLSRSTMILRRILLQQGGQKRPE